MRGHLWDPEFETMPWVRVEAWQAERIARMLDELPRRSEFYRAKLQGRGRWGGLETLATLPMTTKDELRRMQEDAAVGHVFGLQQAVSQTDVVQVVSSSGTTGRPVFYGLTARDVENWNDAIANSFWTAGIRPDDVVAHLVSLPLVAGGWSYAEGFRTLGATVAWLGGYAPDQIMARLRLLHVTALLSTTSFGLYLTEHSIAGTHARDLGIRKLCAGGEPGLSEPEIRRKIAEGWGTAHIRESMGLADVLSLMLSECDDANGMHFNAGKYVAVELVDSITMESVPWQEGARGEAVYTTFDRDATPVVRYRSNDHMEVTGVACPCGRTSPRLRCIGRTDDMLIYKAMNVFPAAIRDVVSRSFNDVVEPYIRIWKDTADQVRFDGPIPVEVEARSGTSHDRYPSVEEAIGRAVRDQLQVRISATLVPPGSLPRSAYKTALIHVKTA